METNLRPLSDLTDPQLQDMIAAHRRAIEQKREELRKLNGTLMELLDQQRRRVRYEMLTET